MTIYRHKAKVQMSYLKTKGQNGYAFVVETDTTVLCYVVFFAITYILHYAP